MAQVLVVIPFPIAEDELGARAVQKDAVQLDARMQLQYVPVRVAPAAYDSHIDYALADLAVAEAGLDAEQEGYDAVCIDTMSDSGVASLRSVLNIPVVGTARTAYTLALQCGERFAVLAMWSVWFPMYKKTLAEMGLSTHCVAMRAAEIAPNNRKLLAGKEESVFPLLLEAARACVTDDGAEVIVLGSTTMHAAHEYLSERMDVPVINPGPASYRFAQMSIELSLTHSRRAFPSPRSTPAKLIHDMVGGVARRES